MQQPDGRREVPADDEHRRRTSRSSAAPTSCDPYAAVVAAAAAASTPVDLHLSSAAAAFHYFRKGVATPEDSFNGVGGGPVNVRILELRKEKSRDAARSRRTKENQEFYELAKMLPLPSAITSQLDKASVIRLTMSYLKLRDFSGHGEPPWNRPYGPLQPLPPPSTSPSYNKHHKGRCRTPCTSLAIDIFEQHHGTHILQSLDGFAFALTPDGRFLYISETVSIYLGLSQVEVTGSSVFDYIHRDDHNEVAEQLGLQNTASQNIGSPAGSVVSDEEVSMTTSPTSGGAPTTLSPISRSADNEHEKQGPSQVIHEEMSKGQMSRSFCIRMKSTLTKRGCHFKSAGYRVVLLLSRMRPQYAMAPNRKSSQSLLGIVVLAIALPPPSVNEVRLESDMFVTRLNFDFKIAHCEPRVEELIDYTAEELTGRNLYSLCYGQDVHKIRKCHVDLMSKGQVMSPYYRLMNRNGGYTWVQTCATVIMNSKSSDEQSIICVNYILSRAELNNIIMDRGQLDGGENDDSDSNIQAENRSNDPSDRKTTSSDFKEESHDREPPCSPDGVKETDSQINGSETVIETPNTQMGCLVEESSKDCTRDSTRKRKRSYSENLMDRQEDGGDGCNVEDSVIKVPVCEDVVQRSPGSDAPLNDVVSPKKDMLVVVDVDTDTKTSDRRSPSDHWIGQQQQQQQQQSSLSASALLRHIYANRESVIRSNFHATATRSPYYSDLVTPSSTDPALLDQSQFLLQSKLTPGSISPPVSPRIDKFQCIGTNGSMSDGIDGRHYDQHLQSFPMKAQMYPVVSSMESLVTSPYSQQQFVGTSTTHHHHHQSVPPTAAPPPPPSSFYNTHHHQHHHPPPGFHLYHTAGLNKVPLHASSITYIDGLKNTSPWYSQSSS